MRLINKMIRYKKSIQERDKAFRTKDEKIVPQPQIAVSSSMVQNVIKRLRKAREMPVSTGQEPSGGVEIAAWAQDHLQKS